MRDFLKQILATIIGLALFSAMSVGGLAALLFAVAFFPRDTAPEVENSSMLTLNLSQPISDGQSDEGNVLSEALSGNRSPQTLPLRTVLTTIERAAQDDRIAGIYLSGDVTSAGLGSGYATLREVRQALQKFRDAGKPIVAYDDTGWSERGYYLASVANTILLNPSGQLGINGFNFETTLYGGALQKYGIGVQPLRAGKFKSAVEPFVRSAISPENRVETQKLLADLWSEFLTTTAKSRKVTPQQLQKIADQQGILLPEQAQTAKLVDRLAYDDEVTAELHKITGEKDQDSFRQIDIEEYAEATVGDEKQQGDRIAVVYAEGNIVSGRGGPGTIGGDRLASTLRDIRQDDDIKAVVLRINSPGGSATASDLIAREVLLLKKEKPVVVSMGSYAASGGYQIATNANRIFASPTTVTGSIGVFGVLPNFQKIANANGITWDTVKTGRLADLDTIARPKTPEELRILQGVVNRLYDRFITLVSTSRSLPKQRVAEIAQGRVWSGAEAKRIGLVDEIGGIEDAIQAAAKEAKLGDDWQTEEYPRQRSFEERVLSQFSSRLLTHVLPPAETLTDPLSVKVQEIREDWDTLRSLNDPLGMYSRLPFTPMID
ncbi:signal peptide peptidase SppA [Leptolyngbya sp. ST-U4]|uniref:signal peptide peptidase SppA n=1 Tax=Leptolyngbya sp. ST-U4 TaxID=2933912 RepID=UPI0019A8159E|nr:signal peptide peptidase SppA [Cyanobacteria bacterium FACHB-502]